LSSFNLFKRQLIGPWTFETTFAVTVK